MKLPVGSRRCLASYRTCGSRCIAAYLELIDKRFTGAGSHGLLYAQDKAVAKKILEFHGLHTPVFARSYRGPITLEGLFKVGLGNMNETVIVNGSTASTPLGGPTTVTPGGIFAQPSNIGSQTHNHFCYVPEINTNLLYNINSNWRAMVGYSFIYWNQVVLAGNQIDRNVNLGQATGGPQVPLPKFQRSDFWVQGISLGGDYRW